MSDVVLDSNALSRWAASDRTLLAYLEATQRANGLVHVPTVCVVESLTGSPRDARLNQLIKAVVEVPLDPPLARAAAALRAAVNDDDIVDPVVVATAAMLQATVITVDPDIRMLAAHTEPLVRTVDPRD